MSWRIPLLTKGHAPWYAPEVQFSNWRGAPHIDYATNVPVASFYSGDDCRSLRYEDFSGMLERLDRGDTVIWGADYYAAYVMSRPLFPGEFFEKYLDRLAEGEVMYLRVYLTNDTLYRFVIN